MTYGFLSRTRDYLPTVLVGNSPSRRVPFIFVTLGSPSTPANNKKGGMARHEQRCICHGRPQGGEFSVIDLRRTSEISVVLRLPVLLLRADDTE